VVADRAVPVGDTGTPGKAQVSVHSAKASGQGRQAKLAQVMVAGDGRLCGRVLACS
jgi:hypothetical protein